jgi:hypothetical protein
MHRLCMYTDRQTRSKLHGGHSRIVYIGCVAMAGYGRGEVSLANHNKARTLNTRLLLLLPSLLDGSFTVSQQWRTTNEVIPRLS